MSIMLGNFSTEQLQIILGIELSKEESDLLESMRQNEASNIAKDKWHCFDMPFVLICGSMDTAIKVHEVLLPYSEKMKRQIKISIEK